MAEFIRSFFAIELPEPNKSKIVNLISSYSDRTGSLVKWVSWNNLHITLKFLGEFNVDHLKGLGSSLSEILGSIPSFNIHFDRLGAFPNTYKPKVIWLGFDYPGYLNQIYTTIENSVVKLGYEPDDRPFSPHLTLGRVRRDVSYGDIRQIGEILINTEFNFSSEFIVDKVKFIRSELTRAGPIYTSLFELELAG